MRPKQPYRGHINTLHLLQLHAAFGPMVGGRSPAVHVPLIVPQSPVEPHVTVGVPMYPLLQVALQVPPAVMLVGQLKAPLAGLVVGAVLHTARQKRQQAGTRTSWLQLVTQFRAAEFYTCKGID